MKKRLIFTFVMMAVSSLLVQAQEQDGGYLQDLAKVVKELRKGNNSVRNTAVVQLSGDKKPKITLMDELTLVGDASQKANEVKGSKGNRFKLNQVVSYVYKKQNNLLESKGDMLNGNEVGISYSAIEKSVKRGGTVTYRIRGHIGRQAFTIVPYKPTTKYKVTIAVDGGQQITKEATDVCDIQLGYVTSRQPIFLSIEYPENKANKDAVESFAILNYNPQK